MVYGRIESLNRKNKTARVTVVLDKSSWSTFVVGNTYTAREFWTAPEGLQAGDVVELTSRDIELKAGHLRAIIVVRLEWRRAA